MCIYSTFWLQWEKENLAPYAVHSDHYWYAQRSADENTSDDRHGSRSRYRTAFEIDKDRITNSQAFRRLEYKTQVFVTHEGDNYRTRLTHSLEVAEIARHIARSLRLNEHLVEAIALGHDLGHAPYGHIAERTINAWLKDLNPPVHTTYHFCHNNHSVENVDHLEPGYDWDARKTDECFAQGLNLTLAVREGLLAHTSMGYRGMVHHRARFNKDFEEAIRKLSDSNRAKGLFLPGSLEAQTVRIADDLAQRIHDLEDGLRSGMLTKGDIGKRLAEFLKALNDKMFHHTDLHAIDIAKLAEQDHLEHIKYQTRVCKIFIDDVVAMLSNPDSIAPSVCDHHNRQTRIDAINSKLSLDEEYRNIYIRAAQVAFLLHMWRDAAYLSKLPDDEQHKYKLRVFKYLRFITDIIDDPKQEYPAYRIVAFLRGAMLANVIEHSFWEIHKRLDPLFRHFDDNLIDAKYYTDDTKCYIIFVVVDGFTYLQHRNKLNFEQIKDSNRLYCFEFNDSNEMDEFIKVHFREILATNGNHLREVNPRPKIIQKICWLNKSEIPGKTRHLKLIGEGLDAQINVDKVRIYFTGYRDLCPGIREGTCSFGKQRKKTCDRSAECDFWSPSVKYPDVTRIIGLQEHMQLLDSFIKNLIAEKIHRGSRVARMNYMGNKIIRFLLDLYLKNPRLMHDRVWSRLRSHPEMDNISLLLQEWVDTPLATKEKSVLPEKVLECLTEPDHPNRKCNHFSLVRRIIEHVAGMTDRYISAEFNRVNQSGREIERQDETYFFY